MNCYGILEAVFFNALEELKDMGEIGLSCGVRPYDNMEIPHFEIKFFETLEIRGSDSLYSHFRLSQGTADTSAFIQLYSSNSSPRKVLPR